MTAFCRMLYMPGLAATVAPSHRGVGALPCRDNGASTSPRPSSKEAAKRYQNALWEVRSALQLLNASRWSLFQTPPPPSRCSPPADLSLAKVLAASLFIGFHPNFSLPLLLSPTSTRPAIDAALLFGDVNCCPSMMHCGHRRRAPRVSRPTFPPASSPRYRCKSWPHVGRESRRCFCRRTASPACRRRLAA